MSETAVTVQGLTKIFPIPFQRRVVVAVEDLSFSVREGEIYGLLGPNGSGKSTTFKMIIGLLSPTRGEASIYGTDSNRVESRSDLGFLPESPYFYKFLTGRETLRFYGKLCGLHGAVLRDRTEELLNLVGLAEAADRPLRGYSKGMLQRIGLAQALVQDPRILLLDEPTAGLDPAGSRRIRDLILELKERGKTVLLSSHLLAQMQEVCDRVGILSRGRLIREGPLDDLLGVENRIEIVLENADPALLAELDQLVSRRGARLVEQRRAKTSLERFFLRATESEKDV